MQDIQIYEQEILKALRPFRDTNRARFLAGYLNTDRELLGLAVPEQRAVAKRGFSFVDKPQTEIDRIWHNLAMQTESFEVFSQALFYYEKREDLVDLKHWRMLKQWVRRVDNWAHSDSLSSLYAQWHEKYPNEVYAQYIKWNGSSYPWEVRASLVGLFYYARGRKQQPSFTKALRMVRGAFSHTDVYVQKGIGWCLREMYTVYPEQTYVFLLKQAKGLAPAAWQAATEKLSLTQKQRLKQLRKKV